MGRVKLLEVLGRAEQTLAQIEKLRQEIAQAINTAIDTAALGALRRITIDDMRPHFPKGTRVAALKGRYSTAADLHQSHPDALAALPGIGLVSARAIHAAAQARAAEERIRVRFRLDPEARTERDTWLLVQLQQLQRVEAMAADLRRLYQQVRAQVDPLTADAARYDSRVKMFFSGSKKKRAATDAAARLDQIATGPDVARIRALTTNIASATATRTRTADEVWSTYERDAAALNALLSQFNSSPTDLEASHGYIGKQIASAAEAFNLDTSQLKARLRGYQAFGAQYVLSRRRVIIGDEMGLGKTVQALAVAAHLAAVDGVKHFLVICPASVVVNWSNETVKHTHMRPYEVVGATRDEQLRNWASDGGLAIMTYGMSQRVQLPQRPGLFIIDEAHYLKNPSAKRTQALRSLLGHDDRALFLTGTPMENRLEEFRNLISYLQPDVAAKLRLDGVRPGPMAFRKAVAPAYLRRNQEDVLTELPDLIESEEWVRLGRADSVAYRDAVASGNFMAMRQSAYLTDSASGSAKLERLVELVDEARDTGAKVIVFSYFLKVLEVISQAVAGTVFGPITGSMTSPARQALIDQFTEHSGPATLLSQIEAGGVGLNIQAASVVIIAEPQWKPSTEQQAIARAHRMGQLRTVQVHRILAKDSVDEPIRRLVLQKAGLFDTYARKSAAKEAHADAVDGSWSGKQPTQDDVVRAEQVRLGLNVG